MNTGITLLAYSHPQWANEEHTLVNGYLQWSVMSSIKYGTIDITENYSHIVDFKNRLEAGEFGPIADYVPPVAEE